MACRPHNRYMSNYPDNVTGNEPQIAGYPTVELTGVECSDCEWGGDVEEADVEGYTAYWTCPGCGINNETDDEGPDPDAAWESRYDDDLYDD